LLGLRARPGQGGEGPGCRSLASRGRTVRELNSSVPPGHQAAT
jgi:hypothetical protein